MSLANQQSESRNRHRKGVWGSVGDVKRLTIWQDKDEIKRARRKGHLVQEKTLVKEVNGKPVHKIEYRLDSIHQLFLKTKSA